MNGTQWNSRHYLSAGDREFLLTALTDNAANRDGLLSLLVDPDSLDQILDSPHLTQVIRAGPAALTLSTRLFFYLHLRRAFLDVGLDDRDLADYIAGVCAEFSRAENALFPFKDQSSPVLLSIDYAEEIGAATGSQQFFLHASAGNHYLFMTGFFAAFLKMRSERRGAPGVGYYEEVGRRSFASARDHRLAREYAMESIFDQLVQVFSDVRQQLENVATRLNGEAA